MRIKRLRLLLKKRKKKSQSQIAMAIIQAQLAPFTMRKHRLLASMAKTKKVVSIVLHKAAQHSAFRVERRAFTVRTTL
jgi:hypothetical protein